ncbi:hypothetical protein SAMN04488550_4147 [Gordonia malaquae]|uniref:Uncharacterized protein n=1 Tax=Gordonia malaquae NBRC 108250 TaxID=1223542 RepID=M3UMT9_GORML|nr:hypothetical protein GM1_030_00740 [Gordonia malaquae NBRC 108250]SEE25172.1 hypothetical protein SAMN04488550_4147 [Gordonia malaquae]
MPSGAVVWTSLIVSIAGYEAYCIRSGHADELLSRVLDRARAKHPVANVACRAAVIATALHLCRAYPKRYARYDPFALLRLT